jgi:hypothetical protein
MTNGHIIVIAREGELLIRDNLLGHQEGGEDVLLAIFEPIAYPRAHVIVQVKVGVETW